MAPLTTLAVLFFPGNAHVAIRVRPDLFRHRPILIDLIGADGKIIGKAEAVPAEQVQLHGVLRLAGDRDAAILRSRGIVDHIGITAEGGLRNLCRKGLDGLSVFST